MGSVALQKDIGALRVHKKKVTNIAISLPMNDQIVIAKISELLERNISK